MLFLLVNLPVVLVRGVPERIFKEFFLFLQLVDKFWTHYSLEGRGLFQTAGAILAVAGQPPGGTVLYRGRILKASG